MSAASEREKCGFCGANEREHKVLTCINNLRDRIVELEQQLTRLACPVGGTVNPPDVHTCTPRPRVWKVLDEWRVFGPNNMQWSSDQKRASAQAWADTLNKNAGTTEHTVKRVALIDTDTEETQGHE